MVVKRRKQKMTKFLMAADLKKAAKYASVLDAAAICVTTIQNQDKSGVFRRKC
jgi:hypothetical protein